MNNFWKHRNVFVTGATGFIGANLTARLVREGASVTCLEPDRKNHSSLSLLGLHSSVRTVSGSIDDMPLLERVLDESKIDAVFHLAAQSIIGDANRSPIQTFETNIRGTYLLLEACRLNGNVKRIVVASSDKAYGSHKQLPYMEDFELKGEFPYDVSKACTDMLARSYYAAFRLPASVSRSANVYGPADVNLSRVIPGTILSVLAGENPIIRSDGTPIREFIYIDDVVDAYLLVAENIQKTQGQAFNFGTRAPVNILDLVNKIISLCGMSEKVVPSVQLSDKIKGEIDEQYISGDKMEKVFGWRSQTNLDAGLAKTIDWYRANADRLKREPSQIATKEFTHSS
ncbi:MAG: NAD-dependent epimerase/dehydratase family protein [Blastocatellia bacterium]|nr:NAD-dependent epimerase/dehydratase family protein [Blastocatellia bacterium]